MAAGTRTTPCEGPCERKRKGRGGGPPGGRGRVDGGSKYLDPHSIRGVELSAVRPWPPARTHLQLTVTEMGWGAKHMGPHSIGRVS